MSIYYVSKDAGNDGYDGLSHTFTGGSNGPWATIAKAIGATGVAIKGDTVRIIKGATDYAPGGQISVKNFGAVMESERVIVEGWATGAWPGKYMNPTDRPAIDTGASNTFFIDGVQYLTFRDLITKGTARALQGTNPSYLTMRRCDFQNTGNPIYFTSTFSNFTFEDNTSARGIYCDVGINSVSLQRNYFSACARAFRINGGGAPGVSTITISDNLVANNTLVAFDIANAQNVTITRNTIISSGQTAILGTGIHLFDISDNFIGGVASGDAIKVTGNNVAMGQGTISRNGIISVSGAGIYLQFLTGTAGTGIIAIYNNDILSCGARGISINNISVAGCVVNIYNNIIDGNTAYGIWILTLTGLTVNYNYNCFNNNATANIWLNGVGSQSIGANSIASAPLFYDKSNSNLRLRRLSPCIGAGTIAYPSRHGGPSDMGAYSIGPVAGQSPRRIKNGRYFRGNPVNNYLFTLERTRA